MPSSREWCDDAGAMRRFGRALVRDDRFVCDDASAIALVDKLFRQASLTLIDECPGDGSSARVRAFAQFIRLYRRHVRRLAAEEADAGWGEGPSVFARPSASVTSGMRALPLDLREALLLVVLVGFSHCEAAQALDIPLAAVVDRLCRARLRLAAHMGGPKRDALNDTLWPNAAHLRIVK
ncbi:MAG TPA: sigma factor-like helix-turn-helix DNA-binding protein [Roseiarcus sp.]